MQDVPVEDAQWLASGDTGCATAVSLSSILPTRHHAGNRHLLASLLAKLNRYPVPFGAVRCRQGGSRSGRVAPAGASKSALEADRRAREWSPGSDSN